MKEAIIDSKLIVKIIDSPIPVPGPGEVLIRVVVSGTNPKDWKLPSWFNETGNIGDDIAGTIAGFGSGVVGFHEGDRVAALHPVRTPAGSFAEYAIAPQYLVFPIPGALSYEEASTIPAAAYTSVVALFHELEYPSPWDNMAKKAAKDGTKRPLVVYGASTAIGAYGIKLAQFAGIHPIIAIGSKNSEFVVPFLSAAKGDRIVDYTAQKTDEALIDAIKGAIKEAGAQDGRAYDLYDCVSTTETVKLLSKVVAGPPDTTGRKPRVTIVLPNADTTDADPSVDITFTNCTVVNGESERDKTFGLIWGRVFARGLAEGWFTPHPHEVVKGGLGGLEGALKKLRDGTVRGKKLVIRIGETEGVEG